MLVLQITLTRLYSALYGNHLAFLAISLSLFGVGLGGVLLFVIPKLVEQARFFSRLALLCVATAASSVVVVVYVLRAKPIEKLNSDTLWSLIGLYAISSLPFVLAGVVVAAALRHAAKDVSRLYLFDLLGAAAGGMGAILALRAGAPRAFLIVAIILSGAGLLFAWVARASGGSTRPVQVACVALATAGLMLTSDVFQPWLTLPSLRWVPMDKVEFQKWSEMSLITVDKPQGGIAWMRMDGSAATAILAPDVTPPLHPDEMAYALHEERGPVLVIGSGGGRDIRAALKAGQTEVYAAEINPTIVHHVMQGRYLGFSGGLYQRPDVHVSVADGRSYVRSSPRQYRNIVISLVDTWAAASVGALSLSENSLYTVEAFRDFIQRLVPEGTLIVNRWDAEFERLMALAVAGLRAAGATEPSQHLFACGASRSTSLLIKRTPYSPDEIARLREHCTEHRFAEQFAPDKPKTELRRRLATLPVSAAAPIHPTDLSAPTDDRPFFFYTVPNRLLGQSIRNYKQLEAQNQGLLSLVGLLVASVVVSVPLTLGPLLLVRRRLGGGPRRTGTPRSLVFFTCIGAGFVLVEVALVQNFVLFLGHPVYALSTVLVALLSWTGVGSLLTNKIGADQALKHARLRALLLAGLLVLSALGLSKLLGAAVGVPLVIRLLLTLVMIAPLGLLMGSQAPLGIKVLGDGAPGLIPWCWGLNGLASVVATATGTLLALHIGFSSLLLAGAAIYALAAIAAPRLSPEPTGTGATNEVEAGLARP